MDIYFLRHGIAEDFASSDAARRLTTEGRARCRQAAAGLAALDVQFTAVWSSPLVRARETAELVLPGHRVSIREELANAPLDRLFEALSELPPDAVVLLVGHEPQLSGAVERLLGVEYGAVEMKKAALAQVQIDLRRGSQGGGLLVMLLPPRALRLVGSGAAP
ncbi:MAG: histidine phosphatase family protein [Fimbriimonadaceae bacterium]|nr:histidine phosphatase family protein [Fimbriimonadaceae bacterium]